jgi:hypothetical protein
MANLNKTYQISFSSTGDAGGKNGFSISPTDVNTSTSLTLPGYGRVSYGEFFDNNIVLMLENFARKTPPISPTIGQLWYDMANTSLRVYMGNTLINNLDANTTNRGWAFLQSLTGDMPSYPYCGQQYYDLSIGRIKMWACDAHQWVTLATERDLDKFVKITGDTMTGALSLPGDATQNLEAVPLQQVYNLINASAGDLMHKVIPTGCIVIWSGNISDIPSNWQLCDGTNRTPNLTDRFVLGAGSTYMPGQTDTPTINTAASGTAVDLPSYMALAFIMKMGTGLPPITIPPTTTPPPTTATPVTTVPPCPKTQSWRLPGSYTFTVPANVTSVKVTMIGAGGNGNANMAVSNPGPGGGSGAYFNNVTLPVTPGSSLALRVGAAGEVHTIPEVISGGNSSISDATRGTLIAGGGEGGHWRGGSGLYDERGGAGGAFSGSWTGMIGSGVAGTKGQDGSSSGGNGHGADSLWGTGGSGQSGSGYNGNIVNGQSATGYGAGGGGGGNNAGGGQGSNGGITIVYAAPCGSTVPFSFVWNASGTYSYTVPDGITILYVSGVGGGGNSCGWHDSGYCETSIPGGPGGMAFDVRLDVNPGDILEGTIGVAGTRGGYFACGSAGTATILKLNGNIVFNCSAGSNASGPNGRVGAAGACSINYANPYVSGGTVYSGSKGSGTSGCDGYPYDVYDARSFAEYYKRFDVLGTFPVTIDEANPHNGLARFPGLIKISYR